MLVKIFVSCMPYVIPTLVYLQLLHVQIMVKKLSEGRVQSATIV